VRQTLEDARRDVKRSPVTRDINLLRNNNEVESRAHAVVNALFDRGEYLRFGEGTRADSCLCLRGDRFRVLLKQIKGSELHADGGYGFNGLDKDYSGMLVLMVPLGKDYFIAMPASAINVGGIGITRDDSPTYSPWFIKHAVYADFLRQLYYAVATGLTTFKWPSGRVVDISDIKFADYAVARWQGLTDAQKKALENR
jgi:hypothetical protein